MSRSGQAYGQALYDLAKDENISCEIFEQLSVLDESFEKEPQFLRMLRLPNLKIEERLGILDTCFQGKVHSYVLNFLKLLTQKTLIGQFHSCYAAYREQYYADQNILPVTAVTAFALSQEQTQRLAQKLSVMTGKTALVFNKVDPACMGGIRLDYDGVSVDGTLAARMESICQMLKNTVF